MTAVYCRPQLQYPLSIYLRRFLRLLELRPFLDCELQLQEIHSYWKKNYQKKTLTTY